MTRPTRIEVDALALKHNINQVKRYAAHQSIIAMVKADAYGCGVSAVVPMLDEIADAFGVASLDEAEVVRLYTPKPCILFQGVFSPAELSKNLAQNQFEVVLHTQTQLQWLLETPLDAPLGVWVKVDTGMHRLGFMPDQVLGVITTLKACPWVQDNIRLMTHLASADVPENPQNQLQYEAFDALSLPDGFVEKSMANSATILSVANQDNPPEWLFDVVRPGIMLYGVSPFPAQDALSIGLKPVMQFVSVITVIHTYTPGEPIGYDATWKTARSSRIGVVAAGYGDGYPRNIKRGTPVYIDGALVPIVGRISMDMLTVDLTDFPEISEGARVELWGKNLPVEHIARAAGTIGYELIAQVSPRVRVNRMIV